MAVMDVHAHFQPQFTSPSKGIRHASINHPIRTYMHRAWVHCDRHGTGEMLVQEEEGFYSLVI